MKILNDLFNKVEEWWMTYDIAVYIVIAALVIILTFSYA